MCAVLDSDRGQDERGSHIRRSSCGKDPTSEPRSVPKTHEELGYSDKGMEGRGRRQEKGTDY